MSGAPELVAKPRLCSVCGLPKMAGRAPNATRCLDCTAASRTVPPERRRRASYRWANGTHRA